MVAFDGGGPHVAPLPAGLAAPHPVAFTGRQCVFEALAADRTFGAHGTGFLADDLAAFREEQVRVQAAALGVPHPRGPFHGAEQVADVWEVVVERVRHGRGVR